MFSKLVKLLIRSTTARIGALLIQAGLQVVIKGNCRHQCKYVGYTTIHSTPVVLIMPYYMRFTAEFISIAKKNLLFSTLVLLSVKLLVSD